MYGWASWSKRKGILTLRNPDDRPAEIALDVGQAFELPPDAATKYSLKSPWKEDADKTPIELDGGPAEELDLAAVRSARLRRDSGSTLTWRWCKE